ncbi:MAG: TlpA disulfide reductase family protein [bacterium]
MLNMLHLSEASVTAVALGDREATGRERNHLADCTACRGRLAEVRMLRDEMRVTEAAPVSPTLLHRIESRVATGERIILPVPLPFAELTPRRRFGWFRVAAAVLLVASASIWLTPRSTELVAGGTSGELHFLPLAPRAGDTVHVEYLAPPQLARDTALVLRGRLRTRWDRAYASGTHQQPVATLRRGSDGRFRAAFRMPDSVLYGAFAVENSLGSQVDSRHRRLWELMVHDAAGKPVFEALVQRENDLMGRDMRLAFATARDRAALYPDRPDAWVNVRFHEQINFGQDADTALAAHHARLGRLNGQWRGRPSVPFAVVDGMLSYGREVGAGDDSLQRAVSAHWRPIQRRMIDSDRMDPDAIRAHWWHLNDLGIGPRGSGGANSARAVLPLAEAFWRDVGSRDPSGAEVGFQIARQARDSGVARRTWIDRFAAVAPVWAEGLYRGMADEPALRRDALERLIALSNTLLRPDDSRRALELNRAEGATKDTARAQRVFGLLGDVYLEGGDTASGRQALEHATASGWDVTLFRKVAVAELALGDTLLALASFARVAVDPATSAPTVDSLATTARRLVGTARWNSLLVDAVQTMRIRLLARAVHQRLPDVAFARESGAPAVLQQLSRGRVTVVTFWTTCCGASESQLRALDTLSSRLAAMHAVLIPITDDQLNAETLAFAKVRGVSVPLYFDRSGTARVAFSSWSVPEFFVLDAEGFVRFQHSSLGLVLAQAAALQKASP